MILQDNRGEREENIGPQMKNITLRRADMNKTGREAWDAMT